MKTCKFWYRIIRKEMHIWKHACQSYRPYIYDHVSFGPNSYFRMLKHIWKRVKVQDKPFALTIDGHIGWMEIQSTAMINALMMHTGIDIYNQVLMITIGDILHPRLQRDPNLSPVAITDEFITEEINGQTWKYWLQQPVIDFGGSDSGFCMLLENCVIKIGEPNMEGIASPWPLFWVFPSTEKLSLITCGVCTFIVWAHNTNTLWAGSVRDIEGGKDVCLSKMAMATDVYKLESVLICDPIVPEHKLVKYIIHMRDPKAPMNIYKPEELNESLVFYHTNKEYVDAETERAARDGTL